MMAEDNGVPNNKVPFIYQNGVFEGKASENIKSKMESQGLDVYSFNDSEELKGKIKEIGNGVLVIMTQKGKNQFVCQPCLSDTTSTNDEEITKYKSLLEDIIKIVNIIGDECEEGACIGGPLKICCVNKYTDD